MLRPKDMERLKDQLLKFKDDLGKTGLAPDSPMIRTFLTVQLIKGTNQVKYLTIALLVLTVVLGVLAGLDISLRLRD